MSRPWRAQRNHTPLAVGTSSTRVALRADAIDAQLPSVLIDNASAVTVYVLAGGADVVATADSLRVPAGAQLALEIGTAATHLAVLATGAGTIRWQLGEGTLELPAAGTGGGGGGGGTADSTAANQVTQIARETEIRDRLPAAGAASQATLAELNAAMGAQADAQATDDTGSFSLLARIKRLSDLVKQTVNRLPASTGAKSSAGSLSVTQDTDSTWRTRAFQPTLATGGSLPLVAATTSAAQAVTAGTVIRYGNSTSAPIIIEFGTSSGVVATANGAIEIMPGTSEAIMVPSGATYFAAYCAQAATLKWIVGTGS
jgi:hypothetical protein